jgi:hypothetical protein
MVDKEFELLGEAFIDAQKEKVFEPYERTSSGASFVPNGNVSGVTHTDEETGRLTTFDLVVSYQGKHVAIEVSFQVTTNSVIERKAGQARARREQIEQAGHKIAYVLDGAGNFQRSTALTTICTQSHCTVAFSRNELNVLCDFIKEFFQAS